MKNLRLCLFVLIVILCVAGCSFFQGAQKVVCPYVTTISQAAELLCSLEADSTSTPAQLQQARQLLAATHNNLQLQADSVVARRIFLEKYRQQLQRDPGK